MKHATLGTRHEEFWNFSFEESAKYDLPAMTELIKKLNPRKLTYIGHSTGAAIFLQYSSMFPKSAEAAYELFVAVAPLAVQNHSNYLRPITRFVGRISWVLWVSLQI